MHVLAELQALTASASAGRRKEAEASLPQTHGGKQAPQVMIRTPLQHALQGVPEGEEERAEVEELYAKPGHRVL